MLLQTAEQERDALRTEVASLREQITYMMEGQDKLDVLQAELQKARILAGLTEVEGPGVSVEMNDSTRPAQPGQDPNVFLIHDDDVQKVVNALFAAGAEAISVNGHRLITTSEIICAGNVIIVNGARIAPPIKILAIGNPETLEAGLKMRGGVVDSLVLWGIEVKVKIEEKVTLPAYSGPLNLQYATPVKKGGAS
ncbi:MAG TPA: DUF881 domain-containing protein [Firmicutes bacterium]|nr:DUF881 domain-containing protein [Candidatus Fermentithermobacillaceae bacterium]